MARRLLPLGLAIASGPLVAFAASVVLSSAGLGAGSASSPRCTTAGVSVIQTLSGSNVASVTVSSLPAGCGGATLAATVNNGSVSGSGSATIPAGGGSVTVTLSPTPPASTIELTDIVMVGP